MMAEGEAAGSEWRGGQAASAVSKDFKTLLTNENIAAILPHRYPFLLVDKVIEFEPGKKAVGIKQITANEPQFTGHFPDRPIMPGVLMVEAMAQLSGVLCLQAPVSDGKGLFFFAGTYHRKRAACCEKNDEKINDGEELRSCDRMTSIPGGPICLPSSFSLLQPGTQGRGVTFWIGYIR